MVLPLWRPAAWRARCAGVFAEGAFAAPNAAAAAADASAAAALTLAGPPVAPAPAAKLKPNGCGEVAGGCRDRGPAGVPGVAGAGVAAPPPPPKVNGGLLGACWWVSHQADSAAGAAAAADAAGDCVGLDGGAARPADSGRRGWRGVPTRDGGRVAFAAAAFAAPGGDCGTEHWGARCAPKGAAACELDSGTLNSGGESAGALDAAATPAAGAYGE